MSILLPFPSGCVVGRLIRREKRFFVHVLIDGKPDVAHTNNTGSMIGLLRPGLSARRLLGRGEYEHAQPDA